MVIDHDAQLADASLERVAVNGQRLLAAHRDETDYTTIDAGPAYEFAGPGRATFAMADVIVDQQGRIRLCELNTSNAAGMSAWHGDLLRVRHQVDAIARRLSALPAGAVVLVPMSP